MSDQTSGLRFDVYERVHLPDEMAGIEELEEIELVPRIQVLQQGEQAVLKGNLLLSGIYNAQHTAESQSLEHRIPVEITLPMNRVESLDDISVEIDNFDVDVLSARTLNITGVLSLNGIRLESEPEAEPAWREEPFTVVHKRKDDSWTGQDFAARDEAEEPEEAFAAPADTDDEFQQTPEYAEQRPEQPGETEVSGFVGTAGSDLSANGFAEYDGQQALPPSYELQSESRDAAGRTSPWQPPHNTLRPAPWPKAALSEAETSAFQSASQSGQPYNVWQNSPEAGYPDHAQAGDEDVEEGAFYRPESYAASQQQSEAYTVPRQPVIDWSAFAEHGGQAAQGEEPQTDAAAEPGIAFGEWLANEAASPQRETASEAVRESLSAQKAEDQPQREAQEPTAVPEGQESFAELEAFEADASPERAGASDDQAVQSAASEAEEEASAETGIAADSRVPEPIAQTNAEEEKQMKIAFGSKRPAEADEGQENVGLSTLLHSSRREQEARQAAEQTAAKQEEEAAKPAPGDEIEWKNLFLGRFAEEREFKRVRMCIVQREETLELIAQRYQLNPREIALYNRLQEHSVTEGQVLYIP